MKYIKKTRVKKKDAVFGRYPCCDLVNNSIRFLLDDKPKEVIIDELLLTIQKAGGYFHDDNTKRLKDMGVITIEE